MCEARCIFHIFATKVTHQTKIEFLTPRSLSGQPKRCWSISFKSYVISLKSCMYFSPYYIWYIYILIWKCFPSGFPGGSVVTNPSVNAGDTGSIPDPGRPHMPRSSWGCAPQLLRLCSRAQEPQLLSPRAASTEARAPEPVLHNKRSRCSEKSKQQRRPSTAKNK